jgi:hypothetical protein
VLGLEEELSGLEEPSEEAPSHKSFHEQMGGCVGRGPFPFGQLDFNPS